jgi:predicted MPP superfamily phosphohydrolase
MIRSRRLPILATAAAWLLLVHMLLLAGAAPVVRTIRVALPGWPADTGDLRIAFLSDTHPSAPGDTTRRLRQTVARVEALHPDLILLGGDYIANAALAYDYPTPAALAPFAGLHAPLGVFAMFGNHDWALSRLVGRSLIGIRLPHLENDAVRVGPLAVLAVGDAFSHHADLALTLRRWRAIGGVPIVFTHSPDIVPALPPGIALALAGPTHCGQVRLPMIGAVTTQSRYGFRYGCGVIRERARTTIVSAGLGLSGLPLRLGLGPDLWLVTVGR